MTEFLKMDIFFVIAAIATAILSVLVGLVVYRVLRILKNVENISDMVVHESKNVRQDITEFRTYLREQGSGMKQLLAIIRRKMRRTREK